jgi:hypothetical protein
VVFRNSSKEHLRVVMRREWEEKGLGTIAQLLLTYLRCVVGFRIALKMAVIR